MDPERKWNTKLLGFAFWRSNRNAVEILSACCRSGLLQTYQSVNQVIGMREVGFMQTPVMQNLRWMRLFGDTVFAIGAVAFIWFAICLMIPRKKTRAILVGEPAEA